MFYCVEQFGGDISQGLFIGFTTDGELIVEGNFNQSRKFEDKDSAAGFAEFMNLRADDINCKATEHEWVDHPVESEKVENKTD